MNEQSAVAPPIDRSTMLAFERTRVAYERTMMAWIRTATSLITFGFSVYKFFEFEMKGNPSLQTMVVGPRGFGLTLIGVGLLSLLFGTLDHARDLRALRQQWPGMVARSKAGLVALVIGGLGLLAMLAAFLNL
jgi:putative membrane protein